MKKFILFIVFLAICISAYCIAAESSFVLTKNGNPNATIILPNDATKAEKYACDELIKYVQEMSGATLPISPTVVKGNMIYLGQTTPTKNLLKGFKWEDLKNDGVYIRCNGKNRLIIAGEKGAGEIYSVYEFLEKYCGVKYLCPTEDYIPQTKTIEIPKLDYKFSSPFMSRESYFGVYWGNDNPYTIKMKQNGNMANINNDLGGHYDLLLFCHSILLNLIPPEKYGKDHPDWYAMNNGKRNTAKGAFGTQICYSNKEMVKELTAQVIKQLNEHPDARFIDVSQNDNHNYCRCPECTKLVEKYNESGALLTVINAVAKEVKKTHPGVYVETIAYHDTKVPPKGGIVPEDNVIIRLCNIEADVSKDMTAPRNKLFLDNLTGWSKISKKLYFWNYIVNFNNYLMLHPNYGNLQKNLQLMRDNKVVAVFEQGDSYNQSTCFGYYKSYIDSKLTWDPDLDFNKETEEFMDKFYGPAGKDMKAFIDYTIKRVKAEDVEMTTYMTDNNYFTSEDWIYLFKCLKNALEKSKDNEKYYNRVKFDTTCFYVGYMECPGNVAKAVEKANVLPWSVKEAKVFISKLPEQGVPYWAEGKKFEESIYAGVKKEGATPKECVGLNDEDWFEVQNDKMPGFITDEHTKNVTDPKASNGKAKWMNSKYKDWYCQVPLSSFFTGVTDKKATFYITYRIEPGTNVGNAFNYGIYDSKNKNYPLKETKIMSNETPDGNYKTVCIGTFDFNETGTEGYIFFAGGGDESLSKGLYLDRIFCVY